MNRYLLPAGYEFQKVQNDYERLLAGKELFDRGTLEALDAAKDNNERHEQLKRIHDDLLPFYDDVPAVAPELMRVAADAIKKARDTATIPIETAFGDLDGQTAEHVANEALKLIEDLRYVDIERTFRVLCDLYVTAHTSEERKLILRSFEALARHDLDRWKQVGFGVQNLLHDAISALSDAEKKALRPVITDMCGLFLITAAGHNLAVQLRQLAPCCPTRFDCIRGVSERRSGTPFRPAPSGKFADRKDERGAGTQWRHAVSDGRRTR